ncbi:Recombinational DNA repair protein RecR (RecR) (PDB:2JGR) (PUBMED:26337406) [Commensalibacter communis]|uniref:recombination mediator RecR n=1 Tax=Commensalibacter communis TaxID=2972786 RepID=UPI0022FF6561|nr:recombination mediator RecR [Commensalibacter communis]CAI3934403.1 Recombinational DNA repair protein RecR (RecR) (PDB:2JGR) (PUBMED:26337406) [Commensalibacter communis]
MGGPEIERLIALLSKLPGLGPRSARRATLALLKQPQSRMVPLAQALQQAADHVKTCSECGNLDSSDPCVICSNPDRHAEQICVVETVGDLWALEKTGIFKGRYQVLGGSLSPLAGIGPEDLNIAPLIKRLEDQQVKEIILALGATVDGVTTMHWLYDQLLPWGVKITQVSQGIPMGGSLEVMDEGTLTAALTTRRSV